LLRKEEKKFISMINEQIQVKAEFIMEVFGEKYDHFAKTNG